MKFVSLLKIERVILIACLLIFSPLSQLFAQGPPGGGLDPGAQVPIDGGISLLLAAGVGYGTKKVMDARKKSAARKNLDS